MRKVNKWAAVAACAASLLAAEAYAQYPSGTAALGGLGSRRGTANRAGSPASTVRSMGRTGGMGRSSLGVRGSPFGAGSRKPQRQLSPNRSSTLSPYLNLVPGVTNSFGGQFLLRTQPAFDFEKYTAQQSQALGELRGDLGRLAEQGALAAEPTDLQSGVSTTGHPVSFLNYGSYYPFGR